MGLKEEIEFVLQEEEKRNRRRTHIVHRSSRMMKPTYFAVLVAKLVFWLSKYRMFAWLRKKEAPPVQQQPKRRKKVTIWMVMKDDWKNFKRWIFRQPQKPKLPGSNESWEDWEGQI